MRVAEIPQPWAALGLPTIKAIAEAMNLPRRTVNGWISCGRIPWDTGARNYIEQFFRERGLTPPTWPAKPKP